MQSNKTFPIKFINTAPKWHKRINVPKKTQAYYNILCGVKPEGDLRYIAVLCA